MTEIANLQVVIGADTTGLESGIARASQSVSGLGSTLQAAMGGALVGGIVAAGAAFVGAAKTAMDFEKGLSAISAVSGATASQLEGIRATALQLGKDTSFSASEAAAGMEEMVKAGVSLQDVMGGAGRAALDLAAAGGLSVAESATIASNAMNVFSLKGSDMAHVADVIAGAANASAIDVHDFGFSLSAAGAVAATVGIGFEDLSTAIAVMGQSGLKGSDAGTSLKTMMLNLDPASKTARAAMRELGLITADGANQFFTAEGKAKSFAEIAGVLQTSLKGLTKEQQLSALQTIFGTDAVRAAAIMAKVGAEGFNTMAESMSHVTAQAVANERLNNLAGSIEKLKGSLETGAIILGSMFTPALKDMADAATDMANTAIDALEQIPDVIETIKQVLAGEWAPDSSIRPFTNAVGEAAVMLRDTFGPAVTVVSNFITGTLMPAFDGMAGPIAAAVAAFLGVIATAGVLQAAIAAVTAVLTLLLSPLGLVAIAAAALALAWTTNFLGIQEATAAAWAVILPVLTQLVDWLGTQIPPVLTWISTVGWPALVAAGQAFADWVTGVAIPAITQLIDWLGPQITAVLTWITATGWPALVAAGITFSEWITGTAVPAITLLVDWMGPKLVAVTTWISDTGWPALVAAGTAVGVMVTQVTTFFTALFTELEKRGVFTELGTIWTNVTTLGEALWAVISKIWDIVTKLQAAILSILVPWQTWVDLFGKVTTAAGGSEGALNLVAGAVQLLVKWVDMTVTSITTLLGLLDRLASFKMPSFNLPSFGPGPGGADTSGYGAQTMSFSNVRGAPSSEDEIDAYIAEAFARQGHDPSTAIRVSRAERASIAQMMSGDSGSSFGPFQLHMGGLAGGGNSVGGMGDSFMAATGLDPRDIATWRAQVDYVAANLGSSGWTPFHAAAAQGIGARQGVNTGPPKPALQDMQRMPLGGAPGFDPSQWPGFMQQVDEQLPDYLTSLDTIQQHGAQTFTGVAEVATTQGQALVTASTDSLGNVTRIYSDATGVIGATITSAAGAIVNSWGAMATGTVAQTGVMATGVAEQTNLMATGALTSVTNLGAGILTSVTTTSGTTIATVTDMSGQVTSQYATMANGAVLTMGDMAAGILTSTTDLGTGVMTTVQDMSGNYVTTITDLSGNVTAQYTQLAADVVAQTVVQSEGVQAETQAMSEAVLTSVTDLGEGVLTITQDTSGQMVATITDMAGNVTSTYSSMGSDVTGIAQDAASAVVETFQQAGGDVASAAEDMASSVADAYSEMENVPSIDLGDTVSQFKKATEAAKAYQKALVAAAKASEDLKGSPGGKKGGSKEFAKAAGGPVYFGQEYLVGEHGPELFRPNVSGTIIPNERLQTPSGGGSSGGVSTVVFVIRDPDGRTLEEYYVRGKDLATRRGRS